MSAPCRALIPNSLSAYLHLPLEDTEMLSAAWQYCTCRVQKYPFQLCQPIQHCGSEQMDNLAHLLRTIQKYNLAPADPPKHYSVKYSYDRGASRTL